MDARYTSNPADVFSVMRKSGNGSAADGLRKVKSSISGTATYRLLASASMRTSQTGISSCVDSGFLATSQFHGHPVAAAD